jgi:protein SCO1/2
VSFVYTTCNGTCPLTTAGLERVKRELRERGLWGSRVAFVSITLDPERDTPEVLARYAAAYRAEPSNWLFLTGSSAQVARVIRDWDMWTRVGPSGAIDHPSRIFLVDPRGRIREIYSLETLDSKTLANDVAGLLAETTAPPDAKADRGP